MSRPEDLPVHLRPVTVEISRFWTAEVALAVFELVEDIRDRMLRLHGDQIRDLLKQQQGHVDPDPRIDTGGGEPSF